MTIKTKELDKIVARAETRKNGVYRLGSTAYRVKDGSLTHYANWGEIFQLFGYFSTRVGTYEALSHSGEVAQRELKNQLT